MFVGAVIAVLAYGVWYISTSEKNYIAELISPLPDRLAKMLPEEERKTAAPDPSASSSAEISGAQPGVSEGAGKPAEEKAGKAPDSAAATDATPGAADPAAESSGASTVTTTPESAPPESAPPESAPSETAPGETLQGESAAPSSSAVAEPPRNEAAEESASAGAPASKTENDAAQEKAAQGKTAQEKAAQEKAAQEKAAMQPGDETETRQAAAPETSVASRATAGRIYGAENEGARIVVRAKMNSWIQVRDDVANQLLLTRLLRQGDSYRVPNRDGLKLLAGNAGALEILVDGKTVPPIGPQGAVRRSVMLDATKLRQGKAVVE
jgi:cytoskeleton protein RodZ